MRFLEDAVRRRRIAMIIRWVAIGWIVLAYVVPPLITRGRTNWEEHFDDAFLIGALPGALALALSYLLARSARDSDGTASGTSQ